MTSLACGHTTREPHDSWACFLWCPVCCSYQRIPATVGQEGPLYAWSSVPPGWGNPSRD
jgi:hypothetical protein